MQAEPSQGEQISDAHRISFTCNICGQKNSKQRDRFHREIVDCEGCGSTPRFRGLALAISRRLCGEKHTFGQLLPRNDLRGISMSDWPPLVDALGAKFHHTNTYYHQEPLLDIMSCSALPYGNLDYVICSEVFEHVVPPLEQGFSNLRRLLSKNGLLIFSTPYTAASETTEHYPGMRDFRLVQFDEEWVVVAKNAAGEIDTYRKPIFHGGPGTVLEMRVWGRDHLFGSLRAAGFAQIEELEFDEANGYFWPIIVERPEIGAPSLNKIITARAS